MPKWLTELLPIVALLTLVIVVVGRLPKVDVGHSRAFVVRRVKNWLPVGLTYAFLYMGRYNLNACIDTAFDKTQFASIYSWGALTYGLSFLPNGPLADRFGGKRTILLAAFGSGTMNVLMGLLVLRHAGGTSSTLVPLLSVLYAINMYFQSFGAVSIVKINAPWFHIRERGTFGGIFGILISLGVYFAYDWSAFILKQSSAPWVFFVPAGALFVFGTLDLLFVENTPGEAGHADFELGDASDVGAGAKRSPLLVVLGKMVKTPAILVIAAIEFCSGYARDGILQFYRPFAHETGRAGDFVAGHWGMLSCMAGISGGVVAGIISDRVFGSRRGPVAGVLYAVLVSCACLMFVTLRTPVVGVVVVLMTLSIIGVHGMLSGTASMDFGGKQNVGVVVGVIDGCVYLGTSLGARVLGHVLPEGAAAKDAANWWTWPAAILPVAVLGLTLCTRVWNARPTTAAARAH